MAVIWLFFLQLEERIDSLSKEARSYKNSHEAAVLTVNQLREELKQVCIADLSIKPYFGFSKKCVVVKHFLLEVPSIF